MELGLWQTLALVSFGFTTRPHWVMTTKSCMRRLRRIDSSMAAHVLRPLPGLPGMKEGACHKTARTGRPVHINQPPTKTHLPVFGHVVPLRL